MSQTRKLFGGLPLNDIHDLAGEAAALVNDYQYTPEQAIQEAVKGLRLVPRDLERIQQAMGSFGRRSPNQQVRKKLRQYGQDRGLTPRGHDYRAIDPQEAREIGRQYQDLPREVSKDDPRYRALKQSYDYLRLWIRRQYKQLLGDVKVEPWPKDSEPYPDSKTMRDDVRRNNHLWVYTGGTQTSNHPFFTPEENIMFRAVHDYLTHASEGYEFGPRGEYNAWLHHASTLPEEAHLALENETVGQNFWTNYGPHMDENPNMPLRDRPFVDQPPGVPMPQRPRRSSREAARVSEKKLQVLAPKYTPYLGEQWFNQIATKLSEENLGEYLDWTLNQMKAHVLQKVQYNNTGLEKNGVPIRVQITPRGPWIEGDPEYIKNKGVNQDFNARYAGMEGAFRDTLEILQYYHGAKAKKDPRVQQSLGNWDLNRLKMQQIQDVRRRYPVPAKPRNVHLGEKGQPKGGRLLLERVDQNGVTWGVAEIESIADYDPEILEDQEEIKQRMQACKIYGENSKWCTTTDEDATSYLNHGSLYVVLQDGEAFAQYDPVGKALMGLNDLPLAGQVAPSTFQYIVGLIQEASGQPIPLVGGPEWKESLTEAVHRFQDDMWEHLSEYSGLSSVGMEILNNFGEADDAVSEVENWITELKDAYEDPDILHELLPKLPAELQALEIDEILVELQGIQQDLYGQMQLDDTYREYQNFGQQILDATDWDEVYQVMNRIKDRAPRDVYKELNSSVEAFHDEFLG